MTDPQAPTPPSPPSREAESWCTVAPVPESAPAPTFRHPHRAPDAITHTATYAINGKLHGYVVRFRTSDGGKETLPYTWCTSARDGASHWYWRQWDEPRPLYFPGGLSPQALRRSADASLPTVVLVEGERKADVLHRLLDQNAPDVYCVASWPGGCRAWKKADWSWLAGCTVLAWPDCDAKRKRLTPTERTACESQADKAGALERAQAAKPLLEPHQQPGMAAMLGIAAMLHEAHHCNVQLLPIPAPLSVPDGWDCADAIEKDGWDYARVQALFAQAQVPAGNLAQMKALLEQPAAAQTPPRDGPAGAGNNQVGAAPWPDWLLPFWDDKKGRWATSRKLVIAALESDEALAPVLGLNELSNNIEARQPWPWTHGGVGPITGSTDLMLGDYLTRRYALPSIARAALTEAIETVAHARPFHPVQEYLQNLRHDGVPRLDGWLLHAIGETPDSLPPRTAEYLRLVGRYWLLGMVYRVMQPGCKFDYCPVLEGPGGFGKSTLVEVLASSDYFSDAHFDLTRGKDGQEQVQGRWLYELAELASLGKAEIQLIKAFISSKVDRYRPSYGRTVEAFARQCVLVGTTNENTYLRDRTGNRRFWPIPVRQRIRIAWVQQWRDQLLAEAYAHYQDGAAYTPSPADEARLFVPMQESRMVETAVLSEMTHVLTRDPTAAGIGAVVNALTQFVTISQLTLALGVDAAKSGPALEAQVRSWLDHEGWKRVKRQINGVRAWGYERPADWPRAEPEADELQAPAQPMHEFATAGAGDDVPF